MSHWKKFTSEVLKDTDTDILKKAMNNMKLDINLNIKTISNTWGKEEVDMGFLKDGKAVSLGFKNVNNTLELRGDFYATGIYESTFMDELSQQYTKEKIIKQLSDSMYTIESVELNKENEFEILAYTYA